MKTRVQVSISPLLMEWAETIMAVRGYGSFSELIEDLIRAEYDRRRGTFTPAPHAAGLGSPLVLNDAPAGPASSSTPAVLPGSGTAPAPPVDNHGTPHTDAAAPALPAPQHAPRQSPARTARPAKASSKKVSS